MAQNRITKPTALLNAQGALVQRGYATSLLLAYDRAAIKAGKARIKEWDYYLINNDEFALALTVDDNGYMGLVSASVIDFTTPCETTVSQMFALPLGKLALPKTSTAGVTKHADKKHSFTFTVENGKRRLQGYMDGFRNGERLTFDITLTDEPEDSMVIATPFAGKPKAFYYNQKINCLRAEGSFAVGEKTYAFAPENSFAVLDWGRGVWTYQNTWYWGSASGVADGKRFGFNIGYGFGDTSAATENMLFYDGKAHKLEDVRFNIPGNEEGKPRYTEPWTFTSSDGRFEMDFPPILDRASETNALLICSLQHQVFGKFSGKAVLDDGTVLQIRDLTGFAEKVYNKW